MVLIYVPSELYYMKKWNPNSAMKLGLFVSEMIFWTWIAFGQDNVIYDIYSHLWFSNDIFQITLMKLWLPFLWCLKFENDVLWSSQKRERKMGLVTIPTKWEILLFV